MDRERGDSRLFETPVYSRSLFQRSARSASREVFAQLGRVAYTVEYLAYRLSNLGMNLEPEFHDCLATCRVGRTGAYLYVIVL